MFSTALAVFLCRLVLLVHALCVAFTAPVSLHHDRVYTHPSQERGRERERTMGVSVR